MKKIITFFSLSLILTGIFFACKKKEDEPEKPPFDRKEMLRNIGSNIIIPNYATLKVEAEALDVQVNNFIQNPGASGLQAAKDQFVKTYVAWQLCSPFEFGPGEQELLRANFNTFPTNVEQINNNITSGSYNLEAASNLSAKGFPAIDYLLFGLGNEAETLEKYTSEEKAANRKAYLRALTGEIKNKTNNVYSSWTGGNYLQQFIDNEGTSVGSSLGMLVNEFNFDFENIKNPKIGIPLGKKTLGVAMPEKVEGYYSGISQRLASRNIQTIENIFNGKSEAGIVGVGLADYLNYLEAKNGNDLLSDKINSQFAIIHDKMQKIDDPMANTITTNPSVVDAAYIEIQRMVVLTKTDMASAMGILINYQDNDGD